MNSSIENHHTRGLTSEFVSTPSYDQSISTNTKTTSINTNNTDTCREYKEDDIVIINKFSDIEIHDHNEHNTAMKDNSTNKRSTQSTPSAYSTQPPVDFNDYDYDDYDRAIITLAMILVCFVLFLNKGFPPDAAPGGQKQNRQSTSQSKIPPESESPFTVTQETGVLCGYLIGMYKETLNTVQHTITMEKELIQTDTYTSNDTPNVCEFLEGKPLSEQIFCHIVDTVVNNLSNDNDTSAMPNPTRWDITNVSMTLMVYDIICTVKNILLGKLKV